MHRIWGTIYRILFCFCDSLSSDCKYVRLCLLVLQARKIMVSCFDYFRLNHPVKFYLFLKLERMGNSFHANFLLQSLDTPPESVCFGFSLFSLQIIFYFLSGLCPEFIVICGKFHIIGVWCLLGHTGSDTLRFIFTSGQTSLQALVKHVPQMKDKVRNQGFDCTTSEGQKTLLTVTSGIL